MPYTKQQLLQKVTPILPPASYKSHQSHPPTSPGHADSAGDVSINVESSDSEGYEDVMSDEEEGAVVKSQWTTGVTSTTAPAEVSCTAAIQSLPKSSIAKHISEGQLILLYILFCVYVCMSVML